MTERFRKSFTFEGKRYYVEASSEKELWVRYANKMRDLEENVVKASNMTVGEWALKVLDVYKANVTPAVRTKYEWEYKFYITDCIGSYRLKDVKPIDLQQLMNRVTGRSPKTITAVYQNIKFIFKTAYDNQLISINPALSIKKVPGEVKVKRRAITHEEESAMIKAVEKVYNGHMYLFMLYCGCRPKEARYLKGEDLFLNSAGNPMLHIRGTKTVNADRVVPCPAFLYAKYCKHDGYLFVTTKGEPYTEGNFQFLNKRLYKQMDVILGAEVHNGNIIESKLADDFTPYCLRHTYCTNLAKHGVDIRIAQKLMGHSDIKMTANIYTHVNTEELDLTDFLNAISPHDSHVSA